MGAPLADVLANATPANPSLAEIDCGGPKSRCTRGEGEGKTDSAQAFAALPSRRCPPFSRVPAYIN